MSSGGNIYIAGGDLTIGKATISGGKVGTKDNSIVVSASNSTDLNITGGTVDGLFLVNKIGTFNISGNPRFRIWTLTAMF